jgi:hypothetical protein
MRIVWTLGLACVPSAVACSQGDGRDEETSTNGDAVETECGACAHRAMQGCFRQSAADIVRCVVCDSCATACDDAAALLCNPGGVAGHAVAVDLAPPATSHSSFCYSIACDSGHVSKCFDVEADLCTSLCAESVCPDVASAQCASQCR